MIRRTDDNPPPPGGLLDRARIVEAGLTYLDRHGLAALSTSRLSDSLGLSPRQLQRYVEDRGDLLEAIAQHLLREVLERADVPAATDDWQDVLRRLAHALRETVQQHPHAIPVLATRPAQAPWIEPPLRDLDCAEAVLRSLLGDGFTEQQAVAAYRRFNRFLLARVLADAARPASGPSERAVTPAHELVGYPSLLQVSGVLAAADDSPGFEDALEEFLDGISGGATSGDLPGLSARESEILELLTEGLSNQQIGERAFIGENTVKTHLRAIFDKIGVNTRTRAVLWAVQNGFGREARAAHDSREVAGR